MEDGKIEIQFEDTYLQPSASGDLVCVFDFNEDPSDGDPIIASACTYASGELTIYAPEQADVLAGDVWIYISMKNTNDDIAE